jgi:hypothetical protein
MGAKGERCEYLGVIPQVNHPELRKVAWRLYKFGIIILFSAVVKEASSASVDNRRVAIAAMISAIPASADYLGGAPRHRADGQCWKGSKGSEGFGYWQPCPQPASNSTAGRRGKPGQPGEPAIDSESRSGGAAASQ